jgi:hypothetical protein
MESVKEWETLTHIVVFCEDDISPFILISISSLGGIQCTVDKVMSESAVFLLHCLDVSPVVHVGIRQIRHGFFYSVYEVAAPSLDIWKPRPK